MKDYNIVITEDGSHTIYDINSKEHFHSVFGAVTESKYIFIQNGLMSYKSSSNKLNILEIGFGTGLNAFLTFITNENIFKSINYVAIEPFPLPESVFSDLNYPEVLKRNDLKDIFLKMHNSTFNIPFYINDNFILYKLEEKIEDIRLTQYGFDLIYFDAFSPKVQSELWTVEIFEKIFDSLKIGGQLVTYSSSGNVKRNLQTAGFEISLLPGPAGKRHITSAKKNILPQFCSHNH